LAHRPYNSVRTNALHCEECFDCFAGVTIGNRPCNPGSPNQQWERADPYIRNRTTPNKVLAIGREYRLPLIGGGIKRWCCLTSVCRLHQA